MEPFPELERAKLRRRLQQAIDGEPADVDRGVQLACLGAIASLFSVTAEDEILTLGHVYKRTGTRTGKRRRWRRRRRRRRPGVAVRAVVLHSGQQGESTVLE